MSYIEAILISATMLIQPTLAGTGQILLGIMVAIAAVFDIRYRRIPNWLVLAGTIVGFSWNVYTSGWSGLLRAAEGFGLSVLPFISRYICFAPAARVT